VENLKDILIVSGEISGKNWENIKKLIRNPLDYHLAYSLEE